MKHVISVLAASCIVLLVLASGCANNISADTIKGKHFGNTFDASPENVKAMSCFTNALWGPDGKRGSPVY